MKEQYFCDLLLKTEREGVKELLAWLGTTDFFTAPASTKYHDSEMYGLLNHSIAVYEALNELNTRLPWLQLPQSSVIIVSLLHDICKADCYKTEKRWTKNNGQWEQYDTYTFDEQFKFGGHGSKSVYLAQKYIKLTDDEAVAINNHMGFADNQYVSQVYENSALAWALHVADELATFRIGWSL